MGAGLTPWMQLKVDHLLDYARSIGINARVSEGLRTCARQTSIYEGGSGATMVSGCNSWHVWGRAVDLLIDGGRRDDYAALADEWKRWGGGWGGDWAAPKDDFGHFEWHPDIASIRDLCQGPESCPNPTVPWPDDRPFFERPGVQVTAGLIFLAGGVYLARRLVTV